ncbi:MAG: hypothetical protein H6Q89_4184, partial [Myxococcaceae bacterium]|nr:hypothetical protein [Myxococcaceae bacterium]
CVTNPLKLDTDDDGLPDGVEQGVQMPGADAAICKYTAIIFDTEPATKTGACNADTDGDGIQDGAEDGNHNGKVDPGELNPNLGTDGTGPAQQACATANLKPVIFQSSGLGDVQVALVPGYSEFGRLNEGGEKGIIFFDPTSKIAGLVLSKAPAGADATAEEAFGRGRFGPVTNPLTQTFTTWDGFATSVRATYDAASAADLKTRINDIAKAYLGNNVMGLLQGAGGAVGPFKIQAQFVRRTATRAVVLIAIVPAASYTGQNIFQLDDTAGGSALAQFGDYTSTTCEVFLSDINAKVDFLWVVDDSCSMADSQQAVSRTGALVGQRLTTAGLDWRAAGVATGYNDNQCSNGCTRAFTSDPALMTRWFTTGDALLWGTSGSGFEQSLGSARKTIQSDLLPRNAAGTGNKIRDGAQLHLLLVGDVDDQTSGVTGPTFLSFFNNFDGANSAVSKAVVHGIVCPANTRCSTQESMNPAVTKDSAVISGTGGIGADIRTFNVPNPSAAQQAQQTAVIDSILSAVINGTGHQLLKPPISSTIKIAIEAGGTKGTCNVNDIPRDRSNGFDFDSASRRVVFFGSCIPIAAGKKVAVSYRSWLDASPDPNGDPCGGACTGLKVCEPNTKSCVCPTTPSNCGGACATGTICDLNTCTCGPGIN